MSALVLGPARLVTLIGPGGIGKTRLAEEVARRLARARGVAVFVVRLAQVAEGADAVVVREAVAAAVLAEGRVGASAWQGALDRLESVQAAGPGAGVLVVVDNCEHVRAGARAVIGELLEAVAGVTVLATSRQPLEWADEQLVTVAPLSGAQSLELFRQRAELAGRGTLERGQVKVAQQICGHMHGNPLYIRLAAARVFYEPLAMILAQLSGESGDGRMRWRPRDQAGVEQRHRTITDVIAWSYELCADNQRVLFERLSVFAPGYDVNPDDGPGALADMGAELEAIEAVCADDDAIQGGITRAEIAGLLEALVDQSLVSLHLSADTVHYYLLESLRLFAAQRLAQRAADEPARLAGRHCHYYRDKVLHAREVWFGPAEQDVLKWAPGAWSNIQWAIDASISACQPLVGLQICVAVLSLRASFFLGSLPEIRRRIEQILAGTDAPGPELGELQLFARAQLARLALLEGSPDEAEELLERCVAACDIQTVPAGHWREYPEVDIGLPPVIDYVWGVELMFVRRDPRSITVLARAREKFHSNADHTGERVSELYEAMAAGFFGSPEQAMTIAQRHLERTTAAGAGLARSWAQLVLAIALTKHGDAEEALQLSRAALSHQVAVGDQWGPNWAVHIRMWSLARLIADQRAAGTTHRSTAIQLAREIAYLAGGVQAQRARLGVTIENLGPVAEETSTAEQIARDTLGPRIYADTENRGTQLFVERAELQRFALDSWTIDSSSPEPMAPPGASSSWQTLSKAEQEVALLAAAGWSNSAIGARRGTSTKTTDAQMSSIFGKLMINSREDIAPFVPRDQRHHVAQESSQVPRQSLHQRRSVQPRPQD